MSIENLLLSQQMQTTENNLRNVMGIESDRQRRAGLFSGGGSLIGGGLGLFAGLALAPATGGASLLNLAKFGGAGAGIGSLVGSGIGTFLGGGRRGDATDIGMNTNIISGREKEFSQSVKDRYNTSISDFQDNLNTRILTDALKSGIQGAAFSAMNPMLAGKIQSTTRNVLGMQPASLGATTASLGTTPANLSAAQEYNPFSNNLNRSNPLNYEPLDPTRINDLSIISGAAPAPSSDPAELYLSQLSDTSASSTGTVVPDPTLSFSNTDIFAPGEVDFIGPIQGSSTTSNANMNQGNNFFNLIMRRLMGATPTVQAPGINQNQNITEDLFKKSIYESVKQQENSVAKNNPYGVNLPRKKTNIEKIKNLGGSVMMGSRSLLEFQDMETGMRTGENIINNILKKSKNDPATFYSNYSGLPKNSPEVSSFVSIFNKNFKPIEAQRLYDFPLTF